MALGPWSHSLDGLVLQLLNGLSPTIGDACADDAIPMRRERSVNRYMRGGSKPCRMAFPIASDRRERPAAGRRGRRDPSRQVKRGDHMTCAHIARRLGRWWKTEFVLANEPDVR